MPLEHTGVAIGSFHHFKRDDETNPGKWYHGFLYLTLPGAQWECALDVDTQTGAGIAYRIVDDARASHLGAVSSLADGWHELAHTSTSGALDYVRTPWLQDRWVVHRLRRLKHRRAFSRSQHRSGPPGGGTMPDPEGPGPDGPFIPDWIDSFLELKGWLLGKLRPWLPVKVPILIRHSYPWITSTGDNALTALETLLPQATKVYVFGQRYSSPPTTGVHNVHMNQGDPPNTQWYAKNGTWQDGAVALRLTDDRLVVWQVKFNNQSLNTDDGGHPV